MKYALHPSLLTALWLGLLSIQTKTKYPSIENDVPHEISHAITDQMQLGWLQLYTGCFVKSWASAIDNLYPSLALAGRQILTILIQMIWKYVLDTWATCNQHLHNDRGNLSTPNYQQAILTMYETRAQLPTKIQEALFNQPIEQILNQTLEFLCKWII